MNHDLLKDTNDKIKCQIVPNYEESRKVLIECKKPNL